MREELDRHIKVHLNTLFHSKTGNLIQGEEYSKLFGEDVITRLDEAKKRVNSELKYPREDKGDREGILRTHPIP